MGLEKSTGIFSIKLEDIFKDAAKEIGVGINEQKEIQFGVPDVDGNKMVLCIPFAYKVPEKAQELSKEWDIMKSLWPDILPSSIMEKMFEEAETNEQADKVDWKKLFREAINKTKALNM
jgi:hypothetical protein